MNLPEDELSEYGQDYVRVTSEPRTYQQAIYEAADLTPDPEDVENTEYCRALYELIARMWAVEDTPTDVVAVEQDVAASRRALSGLDA